MTYPPEPPAPTYRPDAASNYPTDAPQTANPIDHSSSVYPVEGAPSAYPDAASTYPSSAPQTPPGFGSGAGSDSSTTDVAKEQASEVGDTAAQAGAQVAGVAKEQVANVAEQAKTEAKNLLGQTRDELSSQAGTQQQRVAGGLRSLGSELHAVADGTAAEQDGPTRQFARQAADRISTAASWLEDREPGQVLSEVQRFARQRPGAFLALAAVAGLAAGRLTRGLTADSQSDSSQTDSFGAVPGQPVAYPVDPSQFAGSPHSMNDPAPAYGTAMPPPGPAQSFGVPEPAPAAWTQGPTPIFDDAGYQDPDAGRIGQ